MLSVIVWSRMWVNKKETFNDEGRPLWSFFFPISPFQLYYFTLKPIHLSLDSISVSLFPCKIHFKTQDPKSISIDSIGGKQHTEFVLGLFWVRLVLNDTAFSRPLSKSESDKIILIWWISKYLVIERMITNVCGVSLQLGHGEK